MLYHVYARREGSQDWHFIKIFVREPTQEADLETANFVTFEWRTYLIPQDEEEEPDLEEPL